MIPDQYGDFLNIYMQAKDDASGQILHDRYTKQMDLWMKE